MKPYYEDSAVQRLEDIGFYTLCDERARNISVSSPLWRCELIITDRCNFHCPYCRGIKAGLRGDISTTRAFQIIDTWAEGGLKNIRFSGGEPTLHHGLPMMIQYAKNRGVERIAVSTNGSAALGVYGDLIKAGCNDFSFSLDGCCSTEIDKMSGSEGYFDRIITNIRLLSEGVYVTVGIVITEENIEQIAKTIDYAHRIGVADIRIIPSAQFNKYPRDLMNLNSELLEHPILNYRINNLRNGRHVRGLRDSDSPKCYLVQDDMAVVGEYHFPCIIYLREMGQPIGKIDGDVRRERHDWFANHDCFQDSICHDNCLDVCIDFNNKARRMSQSVLSL